MKKMIWLMLIAGLAAIEFPGIFFINRVEPYILGMPFLYGFVVVIWGFLCCVLWVAYRHHWGRN